MSITERFSLAGRTALVTGGGTGLGLEIAWALGEAGARVLVNGRNRERLDAAVGALAGAGLAAEALAFDITDDTARRAAMGGLSAQGLDILVNAVGQRDRRPIGAMHDDDVRRLVEVDLVAGALVSRDAAEIMKTRRWGRIIAITSIAGTVARAGDGVYPAAKQGLTGLMRALAVEYGRFGITSNAIAPGFFATDTNRALAEDPKVAEFVKLRIPAQRWGEPREIAGAALFLASEAASFVNGQVIVVDGGMTVQM